MQHDPTPPGAADAPGDGTAAAGGDPNALPARTTPTWEVEVLLSGASAFALFQVYDALQDGLFDLIQRLSPEMVGLASALGTYLMAGVMALAIGFIAHLAVRAFWAAAVGLHSIDPSGALARTRTLGPVQRALVAARWARMPQRIAELDDWATIVFAVSLGLAKLMLGLILGFMVIYALASAIAAASGGRLETPTVLMGLFALLLAPYFAATVVDGQRGKKNRPPAPWTARVIGVYAALGMTPDNSIGLQMMVHRLSKGQRSYKGTVATMLLTSALLMIVLLVPLVDRLGVGALLRGEFPALLAGQPNALRANHYLDRLPEGEVLRAPVIPSEVARPPFLRLFIPYVAFWHDPMLSACVAKHAAQGPGTEPMADAGAATADEARRRDDDAWRYDETASAAVLACMAEALPVSLDGRPVDAPWQFADDRRDDRRGFVVMIDVRALPPGRHVLEVTQPPEALFEGDPVLPWRIPFWR